MKITIPTLDLLFSQIAQLAKWGSNFHIFWATLLLGSPFSAPKTTEPVSATNHLALSSPCASFACRAVSFRRSNWGLWWLKKWVPVLLPLERHVSPKIAVWSLMLLLWKKHVTANLVGFFPLFFIFFFTFFFISISGIQLAHYLFWSGLQGLQRGLTSSVLWFSKEIKPSNNLTGSN